ncbi:MAG: FHA domain-containing protein [Planctomycetales bacterium]|nr:FHA domain-containing protein [Planctomycetales bacterium]
MMESKITWKVGSDPSCDVVVSEATVSAEHCVITAAGDAYIVEDLQSTNGTFVNGTQISSPTKVTVRDSLTLGRKTKFDWSRIGANLVQIIRIGRADDNDVVFPNSTVSGHHAQIKVDGNSIIIEDLGSSNGTAIGDPQNRIKKSPLSTNDTVYLGTFAVRASQLLRGVDGVSPAAGATMIQPSVRQAHDVEETPTVSLRPAGATRPASTANKGIAGMVVGAVIVIATIFAYPRISPMLSSDPTAQNSSEGTTTSDDGGSNDDSSDDSGTISSSDDPTQTNDSNSTAANEQAASPVSIADSIFTLVASDEDQTVRHRVGTAWAVSANELVTSASVAKVIETIKADYPVTIAFGVDGRKHAMRVADTKTHPKFDALFSEMQSIGQEQQQLNSQIEAATDNVDALIARMRELERARFLVMENMTYYDVAVLTISEKLDDWLELSDLRNNDSVEISGVPMNVVDSSNRFFRPADGAELATLQGHLDGSMRIDKSPGAPSQLFVKTAKAHAELDWRGSPVLNDGKVIGIYSHPTFSPDGDDIAADRCSVTSVQRLRELSPQAFRVTP